MTGLVAVLMGGWSAEREVSLVSGADIARALAEEGYDVVTVDVSRDVSALLSALTPRPDLVFNALHGKGGEDGTIQGILDMLEIPYTHSGLRASAVAMDKRLTKQVLGVHGVPTTDDVVVNRADAIAGRVMDPPYVIKPVDEGSSVGVTIVREGANQIPLTETDWPYGDRVMVERYIPGRELTVAVMDDPDVGAKAMGVTEIRPVSGFYDYTAKYTDGHAVHDCPANVPAPIAEAARTYAVLAHTTLGCSGISRSDFRWDDRRPGTDGLIFLEINTQPGMTPLSLVPEQAVAMGWSYGQLVRWMAEAARCHG